MSNIQEVSFDQIFSMVNLDETPQVENKSIEEVTFTEQQEEGTPIVEEEEKPQEEVNPIQEEQLTENKFKKQLSEKLEKGEIEDVIIEIDGVKTPLSELNDIDEDTYNAVIADDERVKKEEFDNTYVSIKDFSETQKALLGIIKSGDLSKAQALFERPETLVEPFQNYDKENDNHNRQVLALFYKNEGKTPKQIEALIKIAEEDLSLDTDAEAIVNSERKKFIENLKNKEAEAQEAKKREQEVIKVYSKNLEEGFKERKLPDSVIKKYTSIATKYDAEGELEIDKIINEKLKDPKTAIDLIHFVLDQKNYIETVSGEVKKEEQKKILREINVLRDIKKKTNTKEKSEEKENNNPFLGMKFNN